MVFKKGGIPTCSHTGVLNKPKNLNTSGALSKQIENFCFRRFPQNFRSICFVRYCYFWHVPD